MLKDQKVKKSLTTDIFAGWAVVTVVIFAVWFLHLYLFAL